MMWVAWRQHRSEALVIVLLLALLALLLVPVARQMYATYHATHQGTSVAACVLQHSQDPICDALTGDFRRQYGDYSVFLLLLTLLPGLAGMFLGAPLVARELERGTHRLIWTQGVTRRRWVVIKIGALVAGTALAFAALSLLLAWWRGPLDEVSGSQFALGFDLEGAAPVFYALFALALGMAAGALVRKTIAAMAITLVGFVTLRGVVEFVLRPRYLPPVARITDPGQGTPQPYNGDWVLNDGFHYLDRQGHYLTFTEAAGRCTSAVNAAKGFNACLQDQDIRMLNLYQPADRFWLFQGIESAMFFALAALLLAFTIWWVRRRLS